MDGRNTSPFKNFLRILGYLGALGSIIALSLWITSLILRETSVPPGRLYYTMLFGFGFGVPLLVLFCVCLVSLFFWNRHEHKRAMNELQQTISDLETDIANGHAALQESEQKLDENVRLVADLESAAVERDQTIADLRSSRPDTDHLLDDLLAPHLIAMCLQDVTLIERDLRNEKGRRFVKAKCEHIGQLGTYISICEGRFERDQGLLAAIDSNDTTGVQHQYRTLKIQVIQLLKQAHSVLDGAPNTVEESESAIREAHRLVQDAKHSLQVVYETLSR